MQLFRYRFLHYREKSRSIFANKHDLASQALTQGLLHGGWSRLPLIQCFQSVLTYYTVDDQQNDWSDLITNWVNIRSRRDTCGLGTIDYNPQTFCAIVAKALYLSNKLDCYYGFVSKQRHWVFRLSLLSPWHFTAVSSAKRCKIVIFPW